MNNNGITVFEAGLEQCWHCRDLTWNCTLLGDTQTLPATVNPDCEAQGTGTSSIHSYMTELQGFFLGVFSR